MVGGVIFELTTFGLCRDSNIGPLILCDLVSFLDSGVLSQIFPRRQTFYERFLKSLNLADNAQRHWVIQPDLQAVPMAMNHTLQRRDVHIGTPFHFRDGRLVDVAESRASCS